MKTYRIARETDTPGPVEVTVLNGDTAPLQHISVHSPDGFNTGYGGSGPADLALAILADYFGETSRLLTAREKREPMEGEAWLLHHQFKFSFLSQRPLRRGESFDITGTEIAAWLRLKRSQMTGAGESKVAS